MNESSKAQRNQDVKTDNNHFSDAGIFFQNETAFLRIIIL
jgi:hypothetical protein